MDKAHIAGGRVCRANTHTSVRGVLRPMPTLENQPEWVKSSLSFANGNCVEVANLSGGEVGVRNSRDAAGAVLRFTSEEWHAFIGGVQNGEFDRFGA